VYSIHHATKWAEEGFSASLAFGLRPFGIRIRLVAPGAIRTEFYGRSRLRNSSTASRSTGLVLQEPLLDAIRMIEIVQREVAKHYENGIPVVLGMRSRNFPLGGRQCLEPRNHARPLRLVPIHRLGKVDCQQRILCIILSRVIGPNHQSRVAEYEVEPVHEQRLNRGKMAGVLVSRPFRWDRTTLQPVDWHVVDEVDYQRGCPGQLVKKASNF
jgi:hypothetical protein